MNESNTMASAMRNYVGVKQVKAVFMLLGDYNKYRGWDMPENEDPEARGFLVEYPDSNSNHPEHTGYISWSPEDVFLDAYFGLNPSGDGSMITNDDVEAFLGPVTPEQISPKTTLVRADNIKTGFEQFAVSSCVSPENYDQQVGAKLGREEIKGRLWGHLGFVLQWARNGLRNNP